MKKNSIIKTCMRLFALIASIGGVLYLFRDKILSCSIIRNYVNEHPNCPLCSKLKRQNHTNTLDEFDEDEEAFEHAFDEDPATAREYVSLNINPHKNIEKEYEL